MKKTLFIFLLFALNQAFAYEIQGKLKISEQWQPVLFLASIKAPADLFVSSPEFIINSSPIADDGTFFLTGDDLPEDSRFYRLYLVQNSFSAVEFYNQPVRNFMHLVLSNQDKLEIYNSNKDEIFESALFSSSEINQKLHLFENDYYKKKNLLDEGSTKAKRDFLNLSLNKYIRDFTNSCSDPLSGLFALYHIEDKETDFLRNSDFYFNFQERLHLEYPSSLYTHSFDELLNGLVGFRELVCEIPQLSQPWKDWIIGAEAILILLLLIFLFIKNKKETTQNGINPIVLLSDKELKIIEEMNRGMANKEIASKLFIELSTVKTHINSIYKKLGVSRRQDAIDLFNQQGNM